MQSKNEVAQNDLDVIRLFFYACLDIELDYVALICSIVELCTTFMKGTFLESFAEIMDSKMDKINKIQERFLNVQMFEMPKLSQDGSAELSEIFTQFNAESFEKALLSIDRVATSLGKFAKVMIDNKCYNEKVDFTHLKETKKGLVAVVRDCAMACTDVHACLECL